MDSPALLTMISIPPKASNVRCSAFKICCSSFTSIATETTESLPNSPTNSCSQPARRSVLTSVRTMTAPSCTIFRAMALPIPPPLPVTKAILPESALGLGMRCSFASSNSQYSMSNASCLGKAVYALIASAPFITFMAFI
ncbi:hypothetical protein D3C80_1147630 [compost metagenome]